MIFSFLSYFARRLTRSCITLASHHPFCGCLTPKPGFHDSAPRMAFFSPLLSHGRLFYFMYNVLYSLLPSIAQTTYLLYPPQLPSFGHRLVRAPGLHLYKTASLVFVSLT